jgi:hypothetical protein
MDRNKATKIVNQAFGIVDTGQAAKWVGIFEQLGILKLEADPDVIRLCSYESDDTGLIKVDSSNFLNNFFFS